MAASRSEPPAAADQLMEPSKEEMCLPSENKELIVTTTMEELGVQSSNDAAADTREEVEATPTPPESSSLSSENGTVTVATTEEESLSVMLKHIKTNRWPDEEREPGKGWDQVQLFPWKHRVRDAGSELQSCCPQHHAGGVTKS